MRFMVCFTTLAGTAIMALSGPSAQQADGCPDAEKTAREYIKENYATGEDEEKPVLPPYRLRRLIPEVSVAEITLPSAGEDVQPQPVLLFFAMREQCEFVFQTEGEITETIDAASTRYLVVRSEAREGEDHHTDYQILRIGADGEVAQARDQNGQEIYLEETLQKNCPDQFTGSATVWSREAGSKDRIIVRQRQTDRDTKCRVVQDSSSFRYYRLTAEHWELDDGEEEESRPHEKQALRR
jgi:hypothetical protein